MKTLRRSFLGLFVTATMITGAVSPASAGPKQPDIPNQFGCTVNEQRVHRANRFGEGDLPWAKGKSTLECPIFMDELYTNTRLKRHRWYGWQQLDKETKTKLGARHIRDLPTWWNCEGVGRYTYRTYNTHYTEDGGAFSWVFNFVGDSEARFDC